MTLDRRSFFAALLASPLARFLPNRKTAGLSVKMVRQFDHFIGPAFNKHSLGGFYFPIHRAAFSMPAIDLPMPKKRHRTRDEARRARAAASAKPNLRQT